MTRFKLLFLTVLAGLLIFPTVSLHAKTYTVSGPRTITDLGGNPVTLPPADQIKRVVIISPPTTEGVTIDGGFLNSRSAKLSIYDSFAG
jgi:ABC-type Fe3+-hydroxamate transport system substrate-binding protein